MQCPECQTPHPDGQPFCGSCGHTLEQVPATDSPAAPSHDVFCRQCGSSLTMVGDITLARSGLITQVNENALDMLGYKQNEMQGKPFSLFVESTDLVIFFSRLNELLSGMKKQSFEITLKHREKKNIYVKMECFVDQKTSTPIDTVHIFITEITHSRLAAAQLQAQQDLLNLIFSITNNISTVSREHLAHSIHDTLKKICLFAKADRCFIYSINQPMFRLDPVYEWRQPLASLPGVTVKSKNISLSKIKHTLMRLRQEKTIVVHDTAVLTPQERGELTNWYHVDIGALICHIIYSEKYPIGVIGVARNTASDAWEPYGVELVKFFGDFIADRLASSGSDRKIGIKHQQGPARVEKQGRILRPSAPGTRVDISDIDPGFEEASKEISAVAADHAFTGGGMRLEKFSGKQAADKQPVFQRGDGLILLTCPYCGIQDSVSVEQFDMLGNAIRVTCRCRKQFTAVLEKRRFFRKTVHLEGYFALSGEVEPVETSNNTWGPMVVKDLSKTGLQFSSRKAKLVQPGDLLMVRFNLDNMNEALIHKPARVVSVTGYEVGCQFEGADSYDITLGFYFI